MVSYDLRTLATGTSLYDQPILLPLLVSKDVIRTHAGGYFATDLETLVSHSPAT
jgi:hypothetical protein